MIELSGWGRFPRVSTNVDYPLSPSQCAAILETSQPRIARGMGRSYGDSSLANYVLSSRHLDHFLDFNSITGILRCEAGVSFDAILRTFIPRGWFLPVTPGTRFVTVGGAVASDVHGKNHHAVGTFCTHLHSLEIMLGNGEVVSASSSQNVDLFAATCGGMGLTGLILAASIQLVPIQSSAIVETTIKVSHLEELIEAFELHAGATYSVAWIDCMALGSRLGRSLLMLGEHAADGRCELKNGNTFRVPVQMPTGLLNRTSIKIFNSLYYERIRQTQSTRRVSFETYFYPLDSIYEWNRIYGQPGFVQYQFVIPRSAGVSGLRTLLERIAKSGKASFLAVLKIFGKENGNILSFPREGYSIALDFKVEPAVFELLDELDRIILGYGGRLYLTKDARMSEATFKVSYPRWQEFQDIRSRWNAIGKFSSCQSIRLGLQ